MSPRWLPRRLLSVVALTSIVAALSAAGHALGVGGWRGAIQIIGLDPLLGVAELVRLATLAAAAWLAIVTTVDTVACMVRLPRLARIVRRLAPAFWRNLALKPVAAMAVVIPPVLVPVGSIAPVAAQVVGFETAEPSPALPSSFEPPPAALTMVEAGRRPDTPPADHVRVLTMRTYGYADSAAVGPEPSPVAESTSSTTIHVVASGDNLWSIAAAQLTEVRGERPTSRQVTPYWRALIEANRDRLPDPSNPDLLFPGVVLVLPPAE